MKPCLVCCLFALALCLGSPSKANARSLWGQRAVGVVQRVDHATRELELDRSSGAPKRAIRWDRATTFVARSREADSQVLRPGVRVVVVYHLPIFGPPTATKVTWLGNACRCGHRCG